MTAALAQLFIEAANPHALGNSPDEQSLEGILSAHLTAARTAWPSVAVSDADFVRHLATRLETEQPTDLADLRSADLYLAYACSRGDAKAIATFETALFREVDIAAASTRSSADMLDETKAHLRQVLFVGRDGRPPATSDYAGRGDLRGWVRVAALRHMLRLQARAKRELVLDDQGLLDALSPADDPELGYIRDLYRDAFARAFREAVTALDRRDKSLLRYQLIDGLSIDHIGKIHGVHRATAARWLVSARERLAASTRERIASGLGISPDEVESIIRLVRSRLDVSLERWIQD